MKIPVGPIQLESEVYEQVKRIARAEKRSARAQMALWIEQAVREWECMLKEREEAQR